MTIEISNNIYQRSEEPANDFFITQDLPESTIKLVQKHLNLFLGENRDTIKGYF